jgi:hypothetical protein
MYLPFPFSCGELAHVLYRALARSLEKFLRTLRPRFHADHYDYFRLLVLVMALARGQRNFANLYRHLAAQHYWTCFNNFSLVGRRDLELALRQKARELLRALHPQPGDSIYLIIDDSKKAPQEGSCDTT